MEFGDVLIQCKACGKDLRVSEGDLLKANKEAAGRGKTPAVFCELDSGRRYFVLDFVTASEWLEAHRNA